MFKSDLEVSPLFDGQTLVGFCLGLSALAQNNDITKLQSLLGCPNTPIPLGLAERVAQEAPREHIAFLQYQDEDNIPCATLCAFYGAEFESNFNLIDLAIPFEEGDEIGAWWSGESMMLNVRGAELVEGLKALNDRFSKRKVAVCLGDTGLDLNPEEPTPALCLLMVDLVSEESKTKILESDLSELTQQRVQSVAA